MEINPEITEILKEYKIDRDRGLLALLGVYHGLDIDKVVDADTVGAINLTKIVEKDYTKTKNNIKWNVPLFLGQQTDWQWVETEYNVLWNRNKTRKDSNPDCIKRMQEFFKKYPTYRKDDVIKATQNYQASVRDAQYLKPSARFIFDGQGAMKKSILLSWCEKLKEGGSNSQMKGQLLT